MLFDREPILAVREWVSAIHSCSTAEALVEWMVENTYPVYYLGRIVGSTSWIASPWYEAPSDLRPLKMDLTVFWSEKIRNSHSAPKGRLRNFSRQPDIPLHYPGWAGQISYQVPEEWGRGYELNRFLNHVRIFTGTGNGSRNVGDKYVAGSYGVEFYAEDFPSMAMVRNLTV